MEYLEFNVLKFENKFAILENAIYGKINWPIKRLPDEINIGAKVYLTAQLNEPNNKNTNLKQLLEELIN
jgi:hypothetical protein